MDTNLITTLQNYGFSEKEAKVYLTCLELGSSLASTIARRAELNRGTTYSILEDFKRQGTASETIKDEVKYFSVLSPEILFKREEEKYEKMKSGLPDLLALTEKLGTRPKTQSFEGFEGLKQVFQEVLAAGKNMKVPYLSFVGAKKMDQRLQKRLSSDFQRMRQKIKIHTRVIQSKGSEQDEYVKYHKKNYSHITIAENFFNLSNEIVIYGQNKVAILMYDTQEMSALTIESATLHEGLTSLFTLIRNMYKKKK